MGYTKFGEYIRILRIKNHEVMSDTADLFHCTLPFISSVENGKKNIPDTWFGILCEHYQLSEEEQDELSTAIRESKTQIKLNLISATDSQRNAALQFQRSFENMDDATAKKIITLLDKHNVN